MVESILPLKNFTESVLLELTYARRSFLFNVSGQVL